MQDRFARYLLDLRLVLDAIEPQQFEAARDRLGRAERIFVAGLGRSGAIMRAFATRLARCRRRVHVVLEPGCPAFEAGDLLVLGSGSAATRSMVAVAEEARERGAAILLLSANMLGPLRREADLVLYLPPTLPLAPAGNSELEPGRLAFEQALLLVLDALADALDESARSGAADGLGRGPRSQP